MIFLSNCCLSTTVAFYFLSLSTSLAPKVFAARPVGPQGEPPERGREEGMHAIFQPRPRARSGGGAAAPVAREGEEPALGPLVLRGGADPPSDSIDHAPVVAAGEEDDNDCNVVGEEEDEAGGDEGLLPGAAGGHRDFKQGQAPPARHDVMKQCARRRAAGFVVPLAALGCSVSFLLGSTWMAGRVEQAWIRDERCERPLLGEPRTRASPFVFTVLQTQVDALVQEIEGFGFGPHHREPGARAEDPHQRAARTNLVVAPVLRNNRGLLQTYFRERANALYASVFAAENDAVVTLGEMRTLVSLTGGRDAATRSRHREVLYRLVETLRRNGELLDEIPRKKAPLGGQDDYERSDDSPTAATGFHSLEWQLTLATSGELFREDAGPLGDQLRKLFSVVTGPAPPVYGKNPLQDFSNQLARLTTTPKGGFCRSTFSAARAPEVPFFASTSTTRSSSSTLCPYNFGASTDDPEPVVERSLSQLLSVVASISNASSTATKEELHDLQSELAAFASERRQLAGLRRLLLQLTQVVGLALVNRRFRGPRASGELAPIAAEAIAELLRMARRGAAARGSSAPPVEAHDHDHDVAPGKEAADPVKQRRGGSDTDRLDQQQRLPQQETAAAAGGSSRLEHAERKQEGAFDAAEEKLFISSTGEAEVRIRTRSPSRSPVPLLRITSIPSLGSAQDQGRSYGNDRRLRVKSDDVDSSLGDLYTPYMPPGSYSQLAAMKSPYIVTDSTSLNQGALDLEQHEHNSFQPPPAGVEGLRQEVMDATAASMKLSPPGVVRRPRREDERESPTLHERYQDWKDFFQYAAFEDPVLYKERALLDHLSDLITAVHDATLRLEAADTAGYKAP